MFSRESLDRPLVECKIHGSGVLWNYIEAHRTISVEPKLHTCVVTLLLKFEGHR